MGTRMAPSHANIFMRTIKSVTISVFLELKAKTEYHDTTEVEECSV